MSTDQISSDQMLPAVVEIFPAFEPAWHQFLEDWQEEPEELPYYLALGDLARHLLEALGRGETDEFPAVFALVEKWHVEGDSWVQEAATIGLLEGIQNYSGGDSEDAKAYARNFETFLGPESLRWWRKVYKFWDGDSTALRYD